MGRANEGYEVVTLFLNTIPDNVGRSNRNRFGITIADLIGDRSIEDFFICDNFISYRDLFNNLDGDDRVMEGTIGRINSGNLALLASANFIQSWIDEEVVDKDLTDIASRFELNELSDLLETEFPELLNSAINYISSYLFGRIVLTEDFAIDNPDIYETMYHVCEDLLWLICSELTNICDGIERIIDIAYTDYTIFPVARWEEEYLEIGFIRLDDADIPEETLVTLLSRGLIKDERYKDLHKRRF